MRRFEDISKDQLESKIASMRGTEFGEIMCEWLWRYREGCRSELEEMLDHPVEVTLTQGRIDTAKTLLRKLTPTPTPVPPKGA